MRRDGIAVSTIGFRSLLSNIADLLYCIVCSKLRSPRKFLHDLDLSRHRLDWYDTLYRALIVYLGSTDEVHLARIYTIHEEQDPVQVDQFARNKETATLSVRNRR
ncbi:hypothetical protein ES702_06818 [subsurface metagenome]